ncbi:MAG: 30S ribosomal protein S8 [Halobacteriales archaeon]
MTGNDTLAAALSGVNNAERVGHLRYTVQPASNLVRDVLAVFEARGYIDGFEYVEDGKAGKYDVELTGAINECGAVKPRYAVGADEFERWEKRYLPAQNYGTLVVTTSAGVLAHDEARAQGVGGQLIAYVY